MSQTTPIGFVFMPEHLDENHFFAWWLTKTARGQSQSILVFSSHKENQTMASKAANATRVLKQVLATTAPSHVSFRTNLEPCNEDWDFDLGHTHNKDALSADVREIVFAAGVKDVKESQMALHAHDKDGFGEADAPLQVDLKTTPCVIGTRGCPKAVVHLVHQAFMNVERCCNDMLIHALTGAINARLFQLASLNNESWRALSLEVKTVPGTPGRLVDSRTAAMLLAVSGVWHKTGLMEDVWTLFKINCGLHWHDRHLSLDHCDACNPDQLLRESIWMAFRREVSGLTQRAWKQIEELVVDVFAACHRQHKADSPLHFVACTAPCAFGGDTACGERDVYVLDVRIRPGSERTHC